MSEDERLDIGYDSNRSAPFFCNWSGGVVCAGGFSDFFYALSSRLADNSRQKRYRAVFLEKPNQLETIEEMSIRSMVNMHNGRVHLAV